MDFLKEALKSQTEHKPNHTTTNATQVAEHHQSMTTQTHETGVTRPHKQPSTSELMTSAKVVAEAAKASIGHSKEEVDKIKVAGAASDLLNGVKHYGKLEENVGLGKYVGKAETYLHKYESSHSGNVGGPTVAAGSVGVGKENKEDGHGHGGGGGGGASDYFKMAEGFLKK